MEGDEDGWSDAEVCVWVGGRRRWVSGVRSDTTCADLVRALLLHTPPSRHRQGSGDVEGNGRSLEEEWVITERWRSVEQPLAPDATILDIWNAWGDAQSEIRFSLRYVESSGDSGCGSPPRGSPVSSRRRRPRHSRLLPGLLRAQGDTLHRQAKKLRFYKEQDRQITHLEEQAHRNRMAKHGPNYLLESYLRDIAKYQENASKKNDVLDVETNVDGETSKTTKTTNENENQGRSSEATDSPAGNSDSGVGVSGSPQRPHKRRSRGRHLLREHYLTKELADICQINSNRLVPNKNEENSENSSDELSRVQQQIDILEKLAIINKRLQREEELMVRLGAKLRRYLSEEHISFIETEEEIVEMLGNIRKQMEISSKEIENTAIEMEKTSDQLEKRKKMLDDLHKELEEEEAEKQALEVQLNRLNTEEEEYIQQIAGQCNNNVQYSVPLDISKNQYADVNYNYNIPNYPLDTLV